MNSQYLGFGNNLYIKISRELTRILDEINNIAVVITCRKKIITPKHLRLFVTWTKQTILMTTGILYTIFT